MMTTRILPVAQYDRLRGTELQDVASILPADAEVVVVEEAEEIVGCWALIPYYHAEGVWIAPAHRGRAGVAKRLWAGMRELAQQKQTGAILTGCASSEVKALLEHLPAVALPGVTYAVSVRKDA